MLNNLLLSLRRGTVFLGTLYPLFLDAVGGAEGLGRAARSSTAPSCR